MFSAEQKKYLLLILLIVPLTQMAVDVYMPSLPYIAKALVASEVLTKYSLGCYLLAVGLSQLIYGASVDHIGAKRTLVYGTGLYLVATLACIYASNIWLFLLARFFQGLGVGASAIVSNALIGREFSGKTLAKAIAYSTILYSLTPIVAPFIGGYLQTWFHLQASFWFLFWSTLVVLVIVIIYLPVTHEKHGTPFSVSHYASLSLRYAKHPTLICLSVCMGLSYMVECAFASVSTFILQTELHVSPKHYGQILLVMGGAYFLGTISNARALNYADSSRLVYLGVTIMLVGSGTMSLVGFYWPLSILGVTAPMFVVMYGAGFIYSNCMALLLDTFSKDMGVVCSLMCFYILSVTTLGGFIASIDAFGEVGPFGLLVFASSLAIMTLFAQQKKTQPTAEFKRT